MNKSILLICALFFSAGCATTNLPPAPPSNEPMEHANAIHIYTDHEGETAYRTIAQILTDEGFSISSSDPTLLNISTEWRDSERSNGDMFFGTGYRMKVNASVREGEQKFVKLTAQFDPAVSDATVKNQGSGSTYTQRAWQALIALAEKYPEGQIMYARD